MGDFPTESAQIVAQAKRWLAIDRDANTRAEIEAWLHEENVNALTNCFSGSLQFGTAGLRSTLGPGPTQLNLVVIETTTRGVLRYVARTVPDAKERGVVVGRDARRMSREFFDLVLAVAEDEGFRIRAFAEPLPTPLVGHACLVHKAAVGIVVTASHNPPEYNGYKVYFENGCQIVPPHDAGMEAEIRNVRDSALADGSFCELSEPRVEWLSSEAYFDGVRQLLSEHRIDASAKSLRVAYTALHGVGAAYTEKALTLAGITDVHSVATQRTPDGNFPTVRFPNPEEPGAMDALLALAREVQADVALANDPDADRLACAAPQVDGTWRMLSGNELGVLLADFVFSRTGNIPARVALCSVVSSPMLHTVAKSYEVHSDNTLTGFKWISNVGLEQERQGKRFVFGYEEALGYTVGTLVRDKDGVATAAILGALVHELKQQGQTVFDRLNALYVQHGIFLGTQVNRTFAGAEGALRIARIMAHLRANPPKELAGDKVRNVVDLQQAKPPLPTTDALLFEFEGGHRVMARPSGTEPKIKYYFDVVAKTNGEPLKDARARAEGWLQCFVAEFVRIVDGVAP